MRLDDLYLVDIIEANALIVSMLGDASFDVFKLDEKLVAAVELKLIIMGEALSAMKSETRDKLDAVLVRRIRAVRNRIVHGYFTLNPSFVFVNSTRHAPRLAKAAEKVLSELFPETSRRLEDRRDGGQSGDAT